MLRKKMRREPTHPGEILLHEFLQPLGMNQSEFARHVGCTQPKVNEIVTGKRGVTAETAMELSDALNTTPEFWLNLQMAVDLYKAEKGHTRVRKIKGIAG